MPFALHAPAVIERKGIRLKGAPLYLDMQSTTPIDPRVLDAMLPYMTDQFGNPPSRWEGGQAGARGTPRGGGRLVSWLQR